MYEEFQDVGLMTGDVTINPNASVIIMTTEVYKITLFYLDTLIINPLKLIFNLAFNFHFSCI